MPYPKPVYPSEIWDGLTENTNRINTNSVVNPNAADWERIAAEVISLQEEIGVGGIKPDLVEVTGNYAIAKAKLTVVLADASIGVLTVTLLSASDAVGVAYDVKKVDGTANAVVLQAFGSETIDGSNTAILATQYESVTVISNGVEWFIL